MMTKIITTGIVVTLAAMTTANADLIVFDTTPRDDQANFAAGGTVATGAGQTFLADLTADLSQNQLKTIRVDNRAAGAAGTGLYLAVYENDAADGTGWTPGTQVAVSTNTQDMDVDGGFALWTFSNEVLTHNQRYLFTFTSDAVGTTTVPASTGVLLNVGNSEQSAFASGGLAFGGSHSMAAQITTTIPEPSAVALMLIGGVALGLARKRRG